MTPRRLASALTLLLCATLLLPGSAAAPAVAAGSPAVKPLLTGLMTREGAPPAEVADVVRNRAVSLRWAEVQPTADGPLQTAALDAALEEAGQAGARVRLRLFAGAASPAWAMGLGGPPMAGFVDTFDGKQRDVPRFWAPEYGAAYATLHRLLAARYDGDPRLAEVVVARCSAFYPETFLRQLGGAGNRDRLLDAGYTIATDQQCHREQVEAHQVWTTTRSSLALNPAHQLRPDGTATVDGAFTAAMMGYCREVLGARCVLANYSIRSPIESLDQGGKPHYVDMYAAMAATGTPVAFQTAVAGRIGDCGATLDWAVRFPAASVELPRVVTDGGCTREVLVATDRVLGRPTAPRSLGLALRDGGTRVRATWTAPATDAGSPVTAYRVLRAVGTGSFTRLAAVGGATSAWLDPAPPRRSSLASRVVAVNAAGPGPASSTARITTP